MPSMPFSTPPPSTTRSVPTHTAPLLHWPAHLPFPYARYTPPVTPPSSTPTKQRTSVPRRSSPFDQSPRSPLSYPSPPSVSPSCPTPSRPTNTHPYIPLPPQTHHNTPSYPLRHPNYTTHYQYTTIAAIINMACVLLNSVTNPLPSQGWVPVAS